jgi:hypothetical protein
VQIRDAGWMALEAQKQRGSSAVGHRLGGNGGLQAGGQRTTPLDGAFALALCQRSAAALDE